MSSRLEVRMNDHADKKLADIMANTGHGKGAVVRAALSEFAKCETRAQISAIACNKIEEKL